MQIASSIIASGSSSTLRGTDGEQVSDRLVNPTHGYGIILEPADQMPATVQRFEEPLADEQNKRGFGFTV